MVKLINNWITQGHDHHVLIVQSAQLQYETLFLKLYEVFGMKIHMTERQHMQYRGVDELKDFSCENSSGTQIHACSGRKVSVCSCENFIISLPF